MKVLYEIEDMLCDELENIAAKKTLTHEALDNLDEIVDIVKDIRSIHTMEMEYPDEGYSQGYYRKMPIYAYEDGTTGNSYARGRSANAPRDSRGRYMSYGYSGDTKEELHKLMDAAKDEREREAIKAALDHMR